ncbi:MAG: hypothetical protein ACRENH_01080, partial [Gemmatimonadaceae bacterium]
TPLKDGTTMLLAALAASLAVCAGTATWWGGRGGVESDGARRRLGLTSGVALDAVLFGALWLLYAYHEASHTRSVDAGGSIVFLFFLFQGSVIALHAIWTTLAAAWAWRRPHDVRGLAPAGNVAVLSYFLVGSWLFIALLYLTPWVSF